MATAQVTENRGNGLGSTWYLRLGIGTSIPTWTHSKDSIAAAEAPWLKISSQIKDVGVMFKNINYVSRNNLRIILIGISRFLLFIKLYVKSW